MQRHAGDRVFINLENEIVAQSFFEAGAGAFDQLIHLDAFLRQDLDRAYVLFLRRANLLILVGVDERADAFVGKNFREQAFVHAPVDDVDALHAGAAGNRGVLGFGNRLNGKFIPAFLQ